MASPVCRLRARVATKAWCEHNHEYNSKRILFVMYVNTHGREMINQWIGCWGAREHSRVAREHAHPGVFNTHAIVAGVDINEHRGAELPYRCISSEETLFVVFEEAQ